MQGLLLGVLTPVEAIISAAGASGQAFVDALGAGDPIEALTAVINVPAVLTGALLTDSNDGHSSGTPHLQSGRSAASSRPSW